MEVKSNRNTFLIERPFQIYFLVYTVGIAIIISAIFFTASRFFFWKFLEQGRELGLPANHAFFRFLESQQAMLDWTLLIASLISITVLVCYGLYLSNRVAGPIYQLKKHLNNYRNGMDFNDIKFRKKDFFPELAETINESIHYAEKVKK